MLSSSLNGNAFYDRNIAVKLSARSSHKKWQWKPLAEQIFNAHTSKSFAYGQHPMPMQILC